MDRPRPSPHPPADRGIRQRFLPPKPYTEPTPATSMKTAKGLAVPGVIFLLAGAVFLVVGVTVAVPIVLLVGGAVDLLVAAFFALKDPHVVPPRDGDA